MKNIYKIFILMLIMCSVINADAQVCCPDFFFKTDATVSSCDTGQGSAVGTPGKLSSCKSSSFTFSVYPFLPGFTYTWSAVNGTLTSISGNNATVLWNNTSDGVIKVFISDITGQCLDTIESKYALSNIPTAQFTYVPTLSICPGTTINFTSTSLNATNFEWDFGDGNFASGALANHAFAAAGTYTVLLTVQKTRQTEPCGCKDTATAIITVGSGTTPTITSSCNKMLCFGDTAEYCVSPSCPTYIWSANGGTVLSTSGDCAKIIWNAPPINYPATVNVTGGTCAGQCSNIGSLNIPILFNNAPITGPIKVCASSSHAYSILSAPGYNNKWTYSGNGFLVGQDSNVNAVNIIFNNVINSTGTLVCTYTNPFTGCSGSSSKVITIRDKFEIYFPSPSCVGGSSFFGQNLGANSNWSITPNSGFNYFGINVGTPTIQVDWLAAGNYLIEAVPSNPLLFCTISDNFSVLVSDTPNINLIVGSSSYCPGVNSNYSISSNINAGSFYWSVAPNGTIVASMGALTDSIAIDWITATGTQTISVFQIANGCLSSTATLAVNPAAAPLITGGPMNACVDDIVSYTALNNATAGSFAWSINPANGGTILTGQGNNLITAQWHGSIFSPITTNTITVTTCGGSDQIIVNVIQPGITGINLTGNYCAGYILTAATSGVAYQWFLNNVALPLATLPTYTTNVAGVYKLFVYQVIGGCAAKANVTISSRLNPFLIIPCSGFTEAIGDTTVIKVCSSAPISAGFSINPNGNILNYQWYKNNYGTPVGINSPNFTASSLGIYWAIATDIPTGCKDTLGYVKIDTICCNTTFIVTHTDTGCSRTHQFDANVAPVPSPLFPYVWCFGDGGGAVTILDTVTYSYKDAGVYNACVFSKVKVGLDTCAIGGCRNVNVNLAAKFDGSVSCGMVTLTNFSTALAAYATYASSWTATGPGTFTFTPSSTFANPTLSVSAPGTYVITLTISKLGCTSSFTKSFFIPLAIVGITGPNTVCSGTSAPFSATPVTPGNSYVWDFGDFSTSFVAVTNHEYPAPPPSNYTMTLTTTDDYGCTATSTKVITVISPPPTTITLTQTICPGTTVTLNVTPGMPTLNFQWYLNNVAIPLATTPSLVTSSAGAYCATIKTNNLGCQLKTNITNVYLHQAPIALIKTSKLACKSPSMPVTNVTLYNSVLNPNYNYSWNLVGNPTVLSTTDSLFLNIILASNYSYILTIVDNNGCIAKDTFCLIVGNEPNVSISNIGGGCVGKTTTSFVSVLTYPGYSFDYKWTNNDMDSVTQFSTNLIYVTVTDTASGCSTTLNSFLYSAIDLSLFPIGCDTLCDSVAIVIPLALYSFGPSYLGYTINWYKNNNYATSIGTGAFFSLSGLALGLNNLTCTVSNGFCTDTTEAYELFVKGCTPIPLNLSDLEFYVSINSGAAHLNWSMLHQEENLTSFEIQRSHNGLDFDRISNQDAIENQLNYSLLDDQFKSNIVYYRIISNYNTGIKKTSVVRKLLFENETLISIYPNPNSTNEISIQFGFNGEKTIQVYNTLGILIYQIKENKLLAKISTDTWSSGVYTFVITKNDGSRIWKQVVVE
jgi:PKD domain/Secretion system C-terminal sorting domain